MTWIPDVAPLQKIRSVEANTKRNQLVHIFDNTGDWDRAPVQQEGMFGFAKQENRFVYRDENGWHWMQDSLPLIPEWRAGFAVAPNSGNGQIYFSSPMAQAPIVTICANQVWGNGQDGLAIQGTWTDHFQIINLAPGPIHFYWTAITPLTGV